MAVLRVVDRRAGDRRKVTVSWAGGPTHEMDVELPVDDVESEQVRWYLEDYAEFPADPAPTVARDAEALLARVGRQLFERVFAGLGAAKVWTRAEADLSAVRVEIDTDPSDVPGVPWELLRDPDSDQPVALGAAQFVRTHHETARSVRLPEPSPEPLRVLLVICRPGGGDDVPFRSVASRLVRSGMDRLPGLALKVLRPPTFTALDRELRAAAEAGKPYQIVHFDGHALYLARTHHLPGAALGCAQGLRQLYGLTGRATEWARLVTDIQDDYVDPATDQPHPGREDDYSIITEYRVRIASDRRDWPTATRLQTTRITWDRDRAAPYLDLPPDQLDPTGRRYLRTLAASEHLLGMLLYSHEDPACRDHFHTAHDLFERIGDRPGQAAAASSLGNAYLAVPGLRDLDQAQHWHQRDLDLIPEHDRIGRAATHGSLANVAHDRFLDTRTTSAPAEQLAAHLEQARAGYQQALDLLPEDHHEYRAASHNELGNIWQVLGDVARAIGHYQQSIRHKEARGDTYGVGSTRFNIALLLRVNGRSGDALHYARAALTNFHQVGPGAAPMAAETEALIQELEPEAAP